MRHARMILSILTGIVPPFLCEAISPDLLFICIKDLNFVEIQTIHIIFNDKNNALHVTHNETVEI